MNTYSHYGNNNNRIINLFYPEPPDCVEAASSKMTKSERDIRETGPTSQAELAAFSRYKWSTFVCMYIGYLMTMFSRKSFSFVLPAVMEEGHITKGELGE